MCRQRLEFGSIRACSHDAGSAGSCAQVGGPRVFVLLLLLPQHDGLKVRPHRGAMMEPTPAAQARSTPMAARA